MRSYVNVALPIELTQIVRYVHGGDNVIYYYMNSSSSLILSDVWFYK